MPTTEHRPASRRRLGARPLMLVGIGLLLTVTEVDGLGFDFANDTLGYALVVTGAVLARPSGAWWSALAIAAGSAAVVSLFTYGGLVSKVVSGSYFLWEAMFLGSSLLTGVVVTLLALSLRTVTEHPWRRQVLALIGVVTALLTAGQLVARALEIGIYGPTNYLLQLMTVVNGLLALVLLVLAFQEATDPPPP